MKQTDSSYEVTIGNTTFTVCVKQAETAQKPVDTAFRDLCIHDALGGFFPSDGFNLEKLQKTS